MTVKSIRHRVKGGPSQISDSSADLTSQFVLQMIQVSRTYEGVPPVLALRATNLNIVRGDFLAITGRSGSGKSTMLNLMGLLDRPSTGQLIFDGMDIGSLRDSEVAAIRGRRIGFVFQAFHLLAHRTAAENVELGLLYQGVGRIERQRAARDALDRVGLAHRRDVLPTTLSGGERQRVAIARAVARGPELLLCDEPTGNLDGASAEVVLDILTGLHDDGLAIIVVTHDAYVASRAKRRLMMADGSITGSDSNETSSAHVGDGDPVTATYPAVGPTIDIDGEKL